MDLSQTKNSSKKIGKTTNHKFYMEKTFQFKIEPTDQGKRLDKFLSKKMPGFSRAMIQKMVREKNILLNFTETKSSYKLKLGDIIEIAPLDEKMDLAPDSSIKFEIIHDEKDFAIIDKPAGLVVYPGTKHNEKTLINGLLARWPEIKNVGENPSRPGIVHRLDKDTSGIMIIAKNKKAFQYFKNLFKNREVEKTYIALTHGILKPREGIIDFPIRRSKTMPTKQVAIKEKNSKNEGRTAVTRFKVLKYLANNAGNKYTLAEAKPKTGRMHQIRVHFASLGHAIAGDKTYYAKTAKRVPGISRQLLHASSVKFVSLSGKEKKFSSRLPNDFAKFLEALTET